MSYVATLSRLARGKVLEDCESALLEVVGAVKQTHGKGEVHLTLKVEFREDNGRTISVGVMGEVKARVPKSKRAGLDCFVADDLSLTTRDPCQPSLPGMEDLEEKVEWTRALEVIDGKAAAAGA